MIITLAIIILTGILVAVIQVLMIKPDQKLDVHQAQKVQNTQENSKAGNASGNTPESFPSDLMFFN